MTIDALNRPDPGAPSFAPLATHPGLRSDTPIIADMLMEKDGPWRELGAFILPLVNVHLASARGTNDQLVPTAQKALEPTRIFGPTIPAWVKMRDEWLATRRRAGEVG